MGRTATGAFIEYTCADGSRSFSARVMAYGNRHRIKLGTEHERVTRPMAEAGLARIVEQIRLGIWAPPSDDEVEGENDGAAEPPFELAAREWLAWKRAAQLRDSTIRYLEWAVDVHLIPHFGETLPSAIDLTAVRNYTDAQIERRTVIRELREQGLKMEGPRGGAMREMSARSINDTLDVLTELLAWAAGKGWGERDDNPAANWRLKERPRVTFALEPDELRGLIDAASIPRPARRQRPEVVARQETIVRLRDEHVLSWKAIARMVRMAEPTAIYHYQERKNPKRWMPDLARACADKAFITALALTGARVTELCKLDVQQVDLVNGKLRIPDSKTKTGIRDVDMSPTLVAVVSEYFASRQGLRPADAAFPDGEGKRRNKDSVNKQLLKPAVRLANELRAERGGRLIQNVTAHVLRRTYITLAFEAGHPLPYVMAQVGHSDSRMTTEIYYQVNARRDRGEQLAALDRMVASDPG